MHGIVQPQPTAPLHVCLAQWCQQTDWIAFPLLDSSPQLLSGVSKACLWAMSVAQQQHCWTRKSSAVILGQQAATCEVESVKQGRKARTETPWPLLRELRGCSVLVAPTGTENLQPLLALGTRRGVALPHLCRLLLLWYQDSNNCLALQGVLRSVLSTKAWQCRVPLVSPVPLHCNAAHWQGQ